MRSSWALAFMLIGVVAAQTPDAQRCYSHDPDVAIAGCTAMLQSGQQTQEQIARAFSSRGGAYLRKRQYDRAIQDLNEAITRDPNYAPAFQSRGTAYSLEAQNDLAIRDFNQANRLDPKSATSFYARGGVYNVQGQYDRAIQDFDEAIRLKPDLTPVFFAATFRERGLAYVGKGQFGRAIQDYDHALRLYPKLAQASHDRETALNALRRPANVAASESAKSPSVPVPPEVTAGDLEKVTEGMSREQLVKLGTPAGRITTDDDGHLIEIYQYSADGVSLGTVRLTDGIVSSVQIH